MFGYGFSPRSMISDYWWLFKNAAIVLLLVILGGACYYLYQDNKSLSSKVIEHEIKFRQCQERLKEAYEENEQSRKLLESQAQQLADYIDSRPLPPGDETGVTYLPDSVDKLLSDPPKDGEDLREAPSGEADRPQAPRDKEDSWIHKIIPWKKEDKSRKEGRVLLPGSCARLAPVSTEAPRTPYRTSSQEDRDLESSN